MKKMKIFCFMLMVMMLSACGIQYEKAKTNDVNEKYIQYLTGEIADSAGEEFWALGENDTEYAFVDLNGDGRDELLVRRFGTWIYDVVELIDDSIRFANVYNFGSAGDTYINSNNQFVSANIGHANSDGYWVSEIDKNGDGHVVLYFGKEWGTGEADADSPIYYVLENPVGEFSNDDCVEINEEEYEKLCYDYTQENLDIVWMKLDDLHN